MIKTNVDLTGESTGLMLDYDKFKEWENVMPFYKNVKKEGIQLWPAA